MSDGINIKFNKEDHEQFFELLDDFNSYCEKFIKEKDVKEIPINKYTYKSPYVEEKIELIESDPDNINYLADLVMEQTCCQRTTAIKTLRECNYDLVETLIKL